jgi:hypothetical protein
MDMIRQPCSKWKETLHEKFISICFMCRHSTYNIEPQQSLVCWPVWSSRPLHGKDKQLSLYIANPPLNPLLIIDLLWNSLWQDLV